MRRQPLKTFSEDRVEEQAIPRKREIGGFIAADFERNRGVDLDRIPWERLEALLDSLDRTAKRAGLQNLSEMALAIDEIIKEVRRELRTAGRMESLDEQGFGRGRGPRDIADGVVDEWFRRNEDLLALQRRLDQLGSVRGIRKLAQTMSKIVGEARQDGEITDENEREVFRGLEATLIGLKDEVAEDIEGIFQAGVRGGTS